VVNQLAAQRALAAGATTAKVLDLVRGIRERSKVPLVLFTYLNPVYTYGYGRFHADAAAAGADGILPLDLPPDEEARNAELASAHGLKHIRLIAPTTPDERIPTIAAASEGFIYYVSRAGVTGEQDSLADGLAAQVAKIRRATDIPVVVGFGISNPDQAAAVARVADGVVIGSAIVKRIGEYGRSPDLIDRISAFVAPLARAVKSR
jgi:tryptophan synthase alpha chain